MKITLSFNRFFAAAQQHLLTNFYFTASEDADAGHIPDETQQALLREPWQQAIEHLTARMSPWVRDVVTSDDGDTVVIDTAVPTPHRAAALEREWPRSVARVAMHYATAPLDAPVDRCQLAPLLCLYA